MTIQTNQSTLIGKRPADDTMDTQISRYGPQEKKVAHDRFFLTYQIPLLFLTLA